MTTVAVCIKLLVKSRKQHDCNYAKNVLHINHQRDTRKDTFIFPKKRYCIMNATCRLNGNALRCMSRCHTGNCRLSRNALCAHGVCSGAQYTIRTINKKPLSYNLKGGRQFCAKLRVETQVNM